MAKINEKENKEDLVLKENENLKSEIEQLKEMMNKILQQQSKKEEAIEVKSEIVNNDIFDVQVKDIPLNRMVRLMSLFHGTLVLYGINNRKITFNSFGDVAAVSYQDLQNIYSVQRRFAEEGYFFIMDKEIVDALYLDRHYKKIINRQMIEGIIDLPEEDIKHIYEGLSKSLQEAVIDNVAKEVMNDNPKYNKRSKIQFIGELCGKDLYKVADSLKEYNI